MSLVPALHESVFDQLGEGVVVHAVDGRIVACNPAAERILGLSRGQMEGRTSLDPRWAAIHTDGSAFSGQTHPAMLCLKTGLPVREVVMGVHRPDGSLVWILVNAEPMSGPGEAAVVASFSDITREFDAATGRLRATVDSMLDPHLLCEAVRGPDGRIADIKVAEANDAALAFVPRLGTRPARGGWVQCGHRRALADRGRLGAAGHGDRAAAGRGRGRAR